MQLCAMRVDSITKANARHDTDLKCENVNWPHALIGQTVILYVVCVKLSPKLPAGS